jgi:hypothetical protein
MIPRPARKALHRQYGEMLLGRGGSAARAASHLLQAACPGGPVSLAGLDTAAAQTLRCAPQTAAGLALRALELTPPADPGALSRAVAAAEALTAPAGWTRPPGSPMTCWPGRCRRRPRTGCAAPWPRSCAPAAGLRDALAGQVAGAILAAPDQHDSHAAAAALIARAVFAWDSGRLSDGLELMRDAARHRDLCRCPPGPAAAHARRRPGRPAPARRGAGHPARRGQSGAGQHPGAGGAVPAACPHPPGSRPASGGRRGPGGPGRRPDPRRARVRRGRACRAGRDRAAPRPARTRMFRTPILVSQTMPPAASWRWPGCWPTRPSRSPSSAPVPPPAWPKASGPCRPDLVGSADQPGFTYGFRLTARPGCGGPHGKTHARLIGMEPGGEQARHIRSPQRPGPPSWTGVKPMFPTTSPPSQLTPCSRRRRQAAAPD